MELWCPTVRREGPSRLAQGHPVQGLCPGPWLAAVLLTHPMALSRSHVEDPGS